MKNDHLFYHFLAEVKPIASGGLKNRNPRPKIHGYCLFWDKIGKIKNDSLFDLLFYHFLAKVKPIASVGFENRNPRPKILGV